MVFSLSEMEEVSSVNMHDESNSLNAVSETESTGWSESESEPDEEMKSDGQKISKRAFVSLFHYMLQKKDLTGKINTDMDTLLAQFQKNFLIQNLLPKLKFYKEFMKEYQNNLRDLQRNKVMAF